MLRNSCPFLVHWGWETRNSQQQLRKNGSFEYGRIARKADVGIPPLDFPPQNCV